METRNSCTTYFVIVGDFDPDIVSQVLNLPPDASRKKGDKRRGGSEYDSARWEFGRCSEYNVYVSLQMRKTISALIDKVDLLKKIAEDNEVEFYLCVVPEICEGEIAPCLAPDLDIIDFCHATRTKIDIDLYVCGLQDEE